MRFGIRELVFVSLMVALLISTWFFVFRKANTRRMQKVAEMESWDKQLNNLRHASSGIDDMPNKIAELQKAIDFFASKLPQAKEMDKVLTEVSQMADANSLQSNTVKSLKTERGRSYSEQSIQMSLSGDFNGFYSFLLQLEKLPRITRVTSMSLQKISERDGEMTASLTMSIFFEPDTGMVSDDDDSRSAGGSRRVASNR
jgi:type IV pilus assembly protein PilO